MEYICARCKKEIESGAKLFLGAVYCPECCDSVIATPSCSPQSMWCVKVKEVTEDGKYTYLLREKGDEYFIDTFQDVSGLFRKKILPAYQLHFHKLFTYEYNNNTYSSVVAMNVEDGVPFVLTFGFDGGYEGRGKWISFRIQSYLELGQILRRKHQGVQKLFEGLNAENWKEYLDKTYPDRLVSSHTCFVAAGCGPVTRIAVSFQSNPVHNIYYAECPTDVYLDWKKSRGSLENCLYDFRTLPGIATTCLTKKHTPFKARNYMFVVNEKPTEGGNVDIAISENCATNLFLYDSVSYESALKFINIIGDACK